MHRFSFLVLSGIFDRGNSELDILPPPPPFPQIGGKEKELKEAERERRREERKRRKETEIKRIKEEKNIRHKEREKRKKEKLREKQDIVRKKGSDTSGFLGKLGLVRTEEGKKKKETDKGLELRKKEEKEPMFGTLFGESEVDKELKELETLTPKAQKGEKKKKEGLREIKHSIVKKKRERPGFLSRLGFDRTGEEIDKLSFVRTKEEKLENVRQRQEHKKLKKIARQTRIEAKKKETDKGLELRKKEEKEPMFGTLFGESEVDKELKELETLTPKAQKGERSKAKKIEPDIPKTEFEREKPQEVLRSEKEIQKAIESIKEIKRERPSIVKSLFTKRRKREERVERPEVMPRVEEKEDHVMLIEEKLHKSRLALMDFKFDEAKILYMYIMKLYNQLESKKKVKVYHDIKDLYYERKTAEKYAK